MSPALFRFQQMRAWTISLLFPFPTLFRSDARYRQCVSAGWLRVLHSLGALAVYVALGGCGGGQSGGEFNDERAPYDDCACPRSEEHTSELQSRPHLVCRLLLEKKKFCEAL